TAIVVASASGFAAGSLIRVDGEFMRVTTKYVSGTTIPVVRGQDGPATSVHRPGANASVGVGAHFSLPPVGVGAAGTNPQQPAFPLYSYSAAGAIAPVGGIHQLNGTGALVMTLASPTKDQDGVLAILVGNGKAAHTVTVSAGFGAGGGAGDVLTFLGT